MSIKVTISNPNVQPISTIESTKEKTAVKNGMKVQVITPKTKASNKKGLYAAAVTLATVATVTAIGLAAFAYYRSITIQPYCDAKDAPIIQINNGTCSL